MSVEQAATNQPAVKKVKLLGLAAATATEVQKPQVEVKLAAAREQLEQLPQVRWSPSNAGHEAIRTLAIAQL